MLLQSPDKINVLEGDWIDKTWRSQDITPNSVLSRLSQSGFKTFQESLLPFNRLHDDDFWGSFRAIHKIFIAKIDFRHWYYNDDEFQDYVRKVSSIQFPAVMLGDSPYGHERPRQVQVESFEKKLFERTKILSDAIKNKNPKTKIISPSVCLVDYEFRDKYLEYFLYNRQYFDVYSLNCAYDTDERSLALLTALLNELLQVLSKEVWVTRWSVCSSDELVQNTFTIADANWKPPHPSESAQRLKSVFTTIESITKGKSKWFFSGGFKDEYHPSSKIVEPIWKKYPHLYPESSPVWGPSHFMGLVDYHNKIKEPILEALIDLHAKNS